MLMFFMRSLSFVAMFAAGVFYSILDSTIPLWIGCGVILGMMLFDVVYAVKSYCIRSTVDSNAMSRGFFIIFQVVAFHALLFVIMLTATLTAANTTQNKRFRTNQTAIINVTVEGF